MSIADALIKKLRKDIPNANITLEDNSIKIMIPLDSILNEMKAEFSKRMLPSMSIPVDISVEDNNIVIKVRVMP